MKLHRIRQTTNKYCGPAAVSAIAGIDTGEAAREFRKHTGLAQIRGTTTKAMRAVLQNLGYHTRPVVLRQSNCTLAAWLRQSKLKRTEGRIYLVSAGRHWQVVSGRRYICGRTIFPVSIRDKQVKRRCRVKEIFEVLPLER